MRATEQIGKIIIRLPDENSKQFYIFQDLADLFGDEYQSDSVSKLRKELKTLDLKPKPSVDYEADNASIRTSSANTIFETAKIINDLSIPEIKINDKETWTVLYTKLKDWKRPKPQKWTIGDIFTFKVKDDFFVFGQIVGKYPTCALFDLKSDTESFSDDDLRKAKAITLLHLTPNRLNDFSWKVLRSFDVLASKDSGPWGSDKIRIGHKSATSGYLEDVATYFWFGEHDWKDENKLKSLIIKEKGLIKRLFRVK
ncbi:MAG: hypothetical protein COB15_16010 [Flavobacteriales bacterium]|nr:MAG: hypothetical protein COB15_16010 [Flavobacteriales bacterium]